MKNKIINKLYSYKFRIKSKFDIGKKPDFLIIGAQKAGTTSLYNYIEKYAENFSPPTNKELQFFTEKYEKGINFYKSFFENKDGKITGEATPDYLFYHKAPERIVEHLPNVKIIVLLRDPINRAYSQYNFQNCTKKTRAFDPLEFKNAIREDIYRYENNIYLDNEKFNYIYKYFSYVSRSIYYDQLKNWLSFFPLEQINIVNSENFFTNTESELRKIFSFLGLKFKMDGKLEFKQYNKNNYSELDAKTYKFLHEYFKSHNEKLYELLGEDFEW